jgi:hypothetical protein
MPSQRCYEKRLEWPLFGLADEEGRSVGYACLQGPVRNSKEERALIAVSSVAPLIGFTSFVCFPASRGGDDQRCYESMCTAWCHCFQDPDLYFRTQKPLLLLSHSDFTDYSFVSPTRLFQEADRRKDYDFVYVCQAGPGKEWVKNWDLAQRCLPVLCGQLRLKGILIGRDVIPSLPDYGGLLTICGELPWRELMSVFTRSRFLFVPNVMDPSPRIITEALCMNTPILVNRMILGGWKYVNPFTGCFFESEFDVAVGARTCLQQWTSPRRWFIANHGPLLAGRRLSSFLSSFDPGLRRVKHLQLTQTFKFPAEALCDIC